MPIESPYKGKSGLRRVFNALGYSIAGLTSAWQCEAAFRQVLILAAVGIGIVPWLALPLWAIALIVLGHLVCVIVELINSAIEAAVDHTSIEHHPLAKRAKDLGSAAQLISLLNLSFLWGIAIMSSSPTYGFRHAI